MRCSVVWVGLAACWTSAQPPRDTPVRISDPMEQAPRDQSPFTLHGEEIRIFGMYEAPTKRGFREHKQGTVTVHVARGRRQVLVLSSYEATRWKLDLAPGARVTAVVLNGYYHHELDAPHDIRVIDVSGPLKYLAASGNPGTGSGTGDNGAALVAAIEGYLGASVASYHGCYSASEVT